MCGIAGIIDIEATREIDRRAIKAMVDALEHRGPDGAGLHLEPGLAFGHRRLAIIDAEGGKQPFFSGDGSALVYNGEIYNYQTLRGEIASFDRQLKTRSDTEVLAELLDIRGADALHDLHGMFAFAYYNPKTEEFILARDRLGEKPLYTHVTKDGFLLFASEIDALLASGMAPDVLNPAAVAQYMLLGYVPDPRSIYDGIQKLPPAHVLTFRRGRKIGKARRWWSLQMKPQAGCRFEAAVETLAETLEVAVTDQMVADIPVGAFLSGGVDSSAVVAAMMSGRDTPVTTCAMGFDDPARDERAAAREVAGLLGTEHHEFLAASDMARLVPAIAAIYGEPFADSSALPTAMLCAGTREHTKVALSGDGGDEMFAGYARYQGILQESRIRRMLPAGARRAVAPLGAIYPHLPASAPAPLRLRTVLQSVGDGPGHGYARAVSAVLPDRVRAIMTEQMQAWRPGTVIEAAINDSRAGDPVLAAQSADIATWLPGRMLVKIDRASMAAGLEVRPPLLDYRLAEWAATLPRQIKLKGGVGKRVLKEMLRQRLPAEIVDRKKQGFDAPVDSWMRADGGALAHRLMTAEAWKDSGFFDPGAVGHLVDRHLSGAESHGQTLWSVLMFDAFLTRRRADRAMVPEAMAAAGAAPRQTVTA